LIVVEVRQQVEELPAGSAVLTEEAKLDLDETHSHSMIS